MILCTAKGFMLSVWWYARHIMLCTEYYVMHGVWWYVQRWWYTVHMILYALYEVMHGVWCYARGRILCTAYGVMHGIWCYELHDYHSCTLFFFCTIFKNLFSNLNLFLFLSHYNHDTYTRRIAYFKSHLDVGDILVPCAIWYLYKHGFGKT